MFDPPTATVVASLVAALVALLTLRQTVKFNQKLVHVGIFADEQKEVRSRLRELAALMGEMDVAVRNFVEDSGKFDDARLTQEAVHTLAIVSNFFKATNKEKTIDYPAEIRIASEELKEKITRFFLELDFTSDGRKEDFAQDKLKLISHEIRDQVEKCSEHIRKHVSPF
ncbi:MAG: hypothetical protein ABL934_09125 [Lysobacteraceae bacterium]